MWCDVFCGTAIESGPSAARGRAKPRRCSRNYPLVGQHSHHQRAGSPRFSLSARCVPAAPTGRPCNWYTVPLVQSSELSGALRGQYTISKGACGPRHGVLSPTAERRRTLSLGATTQSVFVLHCVSGILTRPTRSRGGHDARFLHGHASVAMPPACSPWSSPLVASPRNPATPSSRRPRGSGGPTLPAPQVCLPPPASFSPPMRVPAAERHCAGDAGERLSDAPAGVTGAARGRCRRPFCLRRPL